MSQRNVVVLQSDAVIRQRLHCVLAQAGMHVESSASPLAFIDGLESGVIPDLLLVDLSLDDIDGWRLCRMLRSPGFAETNALPLLVTSSAAVDADLARIAQHLGACGYLSLPAEDGAVLGAARSAMERAHAAPRPVAMAADPDDGARRMIALALEGAGYDVAEAASLAEARRLFAMRHPRVVVLSDALPDGSALEAVAEWHGLPQARRADCIVVTGRPGRKAEVELARHGVDACISKPFAPQVLERVLADALQARALHGGEALLRQKALRLHDTETIFRELYDKAPLGYHTIGPDGMILSMNATELQWLGYTAEELVGRKTIFDLQLKESAERGRKAFEELRRVGSLHDVELVLLRKDGTPLPVAIEAIAVHDESVAFVLSRTIVRDTTDRQEKEARARQAQRVESMATLVEGVAHNFNNLLTPVLINAGELRESFPQGSEEREIVEEIAEASKRAAKMIRQLALLGRSDRPKYRPVDLRETITAAVSELGETSERSLAIELDIAPGPAVVSGNAAEVKRALMELCYNAREAMPAGGTLTIALSRTPAPAGKSPGQAAKGNDGGWVITVSDSGTGVPPEIRDRVFEPFFTTKPMACYVGLGLSTAYSIMRNHGGRAELDIHARGCTRFVLRFPAPEAHPPCAAPGPEKPS